MLRPFRAASSALCGWFALALMLNVGCGGPTANPPKGGDPKKTSGGGSTEKLAGDVKIDGSSTVLPISEAVGEEFAKVHGDVHVTVGKSGTGGGFKKFIAGEIDISDASRAIKDTEKKALEEKKIEYIEFIIAYDGLAVVANKGNDWVENITVAQLKKMWEPGSTVKSWKDVDPSWPDQELKLFGPGTDSGTFDYFTEVVNGKEKACRAGDTFTASEDDNVLVTGVSGEKGGLGYFGFAYYAANESKLKLLAVEGVKPSDDAVRGGSYKPLSRPLYIYVKKSALARPEVAAFVKFYLDNAESLVKEVHYVPVTAEQAKKNQDALAAALAK
jgi:phosphate transport system substrate-binding protein